MSDETAEQPEEVVEKKGPGLMTLIKAGIIVSVIVVVECLAGSMLFPSAEETASTVRKIASAEAGEEGELDASMENDDPDNTKELKEVSMGDFHVSSYQPKSNTTLRIDFELFATVLASEEADFLELFEQNKARVKEQIDATMRSSQLTDLTDAGLGLIKRRILEKSNRTLGRPLLQEVIFIKFSFMEQ